MDEEGRLRRATQRPCPSPQAGGARLLGEIVSEYITGHVGRQHEAFSNAAAAWDEIVPAEVAGFCRLAEVTRGTARVVVNSPSYLHHLRLQGPELLRQLQQRSGRKVVKQLRFEIGR